jgi:outer membrane immunogenic protein
MSYLTGGLAYGKVDLDGTSTVSGAFSNNISGGIFSLTQAFGHSQVNTGWVAGYGTEGRLGNSNWTWKVEGLYMDLGHLDTAGPGGFVSGAVAGSNTSFAVTSGPVTTHTHFIDGILRGGLNYKFY